MNKTLFCFLIGAVGFVGLKAFEHSNQNYSTDLLLHNVEALSGDENLTNYNICYSESVVRKAHTYYSCDPCVKVYDEKGKGAYSKCFKK
ncbi:MAG: hypothetical protein J6A70_01130 [Prevotella sp.]|nr:hypothetical protein [Prevotella sp.]